MEGLMPAWLETLVGFRFFSPCALHESERKGERNIFCLDCNAAFCVHCLSPHRHHRLLQIRRNIYHDVVRVEDLQRLIVCDSIQPYTANRAKVVFLSERPQTRPFRGWVGQHGCSSCDRTLPGPFIHCSLACKVKHVLSREGCLADHLRSCDLVPLSFDDSQLSPEYVHDYPSAPTSSGSSASPPPEVVRKKRSSIGAVNRRMGVVSRRKGVPSRSPMF